MALVYSESSLTGIQLIICKAARPGDQAQPNRKLPRNSSNLKTPKEFHATDPWGHMWQPRKIQVAFVPRLHWKGAVHLKFGAM
ncbi:hypothetical protein OsI_11205 [Oryza sativa Indica Group]|uniref:Uncharacterized protein n=2 Tax=Oryza sativa TaxID=4530 RepID=B9F7W7_ORYSJ|nr:hypothetical protein OsI_11205 [Oryza sativa Indica Group]EEE58902.1 hypothetical protein OsJ_10534 [Oryza sativa Japonica Group]